MRRDLAVEPIRALLDPDTLEDLRERLGRGRLLSADARGMGAGYATALARGTACRLDSLRRRRVPGPAGPARPTCARTSTGCRCTWCTRRARGPDPLPLVLTHGWPELVLRVPAAAAAAHRPGRAWRRPGATRSRSCCRRCRGSASPAPPPPGGLTAEQVAGLWHTDHDRGLGYRATPPTAATSGAGVTARLARAHPDAVAAIHLATPGLPAPPLPWTPGRAGVRRRGRRRGRRRRAATRTCTPPSPPPSAPALDDSPVALAAWLGEKLIGLEQHHRPTGSRPSTGTCCWARSPSTGRLGPPRRRCCPTGRPPCARERAACRRPAAGARRRSTSSAASSSRSPSHPGNSPNASSR